MVVLGDLQKWRFIGDILALVGEINRRWEIHALHSLPKFTIILTSRGWDVMGLAYDT